MTPGEARQAEANREDGWPYPDDDSDLKEDMTDDIVDVGDDGRFDDDPNPYEGTYNEEEPWTQWDQPEF